MPTTKLPIPQWSWHRGCILYGSFRLDADETLRSSRAIAQFACLIVQVVQFLHTRGRVARALSYQLLKCGTSAGANYEEATTAQAHDKKAKRKIALRELKETKFRLRVLRQCDFLTADHDPVINETDELIRIVATLLRKTDRGK